MCKTSSSDCTAGRSPTSATSVARRSLSPALWRITSGDTQERNRTSVICAACRSRSPPRSSHTPENTQVRRFSLTRGQMWFICSEYGRLQVSMCFRGDSVQMLAAKMWFEFRDVVGAEETHETSSPRWVPRRPGVGSDAFQNVPHLSRLTGVQSASHNVLLLCSEGNNGVQCLLCGNRFASVKNMIKHQEKAHADEVRQHKERARAGELVCVESHRCSWKYKFHYGRQLPVNSNVFFSVSVFVSQSCSWPPVILWPSSRANSPRKTKVWSPSPKASRPTPNRPLPTPKPPRRPPTSSPLTSPLLAALPPTPPPPSWRASSRSLLTPPSPAVTRWPSRPTRSKPSTRTPSTLWWSSCGRRPPPPRAWSRSSSSGRWTTVKTTLLSSEANISPFNIEE